MPIEQAPYDQQGNLLHYASPEQPHDWRSNDPFEATLSLEGVNRGRSSTYFIWTDTEGREFPMFVTDLVALLRGQGVRKGAKVTARWHVVKRGSNHGVALAPE